MWVCRGHVCCLVLTDIVIAALLCCAVLCCAAGKAPISVDEVEDAAEIMKRFCTGGMSLGAISREVRDGTVTLVLLHTVTNSISMVNISY